jgi:hypothetical protein
LDNYLFLQPDPKAQIKLTDFGILFNLWIGLADWATTGDAGRAINEKFAPPEVLNEVKGVDKKKRDTWCLGHILYIFLLIV